MILNKKCMDCIHNNPLIVTYIGKNPNLCQKSRSMNEDNSNCPYYCKNTIKNLDTDYYYTLSLKEDK